MSKDTITISKNELKDIVAAEVAAMMAADLSTEMIMAATVFSGKLLFTLFDKEKKEEQEEEQDEEVNETMDFSQALNCLKNGQCVKRMGWNGKDQYIELAEIVSFKTRTSVRNYEKKSLPAIVFYGTKGIQVGWLASQGDLLADDWVIAK